MVIIKTSQRALNGDVLTEADKAIFKPHRQIWWRKVADIFLHFRRRLRPARAK